jgi:hypothetical protein
MFFGRTSIVALTKERASIGAHGARETPVTIPNTAVKPSSGYNTWVIKPWENSTVPNYMKPVQIGRVLFFRCGKLYIFICSYIFITTKQAIATIDNLNLQII